MYLVCTCLLFYIHWHVCTCIRMYVSIRIMTCKLDMDWGTYLVFRHYCIHVKHTQYPFHFQRSQHSHLYPHKVFGKLGTYHFTQARLATPKLPQQPVYLIDIAAAPSILHSSTQPMIGKSEFLFLLYFLGIVWVALLSKKKRGISTSQAAALHETAILCFMKLPSINTTIAMRTVQSQALQQ